ncbi:MAG: hypothetical protein L0323_19105 [Planctomycetes bacterium]|nr:hypothetical protein [Planctomycetota bacterium]
MTLFETFFGFRPEVRSIKMRPREGVYEVWDCEGNLSVVTPRILWAIRNQHAPILTVRERDGKHAVEMLVQGDPVGMVVSPRGAATVADLASLHGAPV